MQFVPGVAFGNIHFGMSVQEVQSIMGPDCIMEVSDDDDLRLSYYEGRLIFVFYQEDELCLSGVSIQRASVAVEYGGRDLFSMRYDELVEAFLAETDMTDHSFTYYEDVGELESLEFEYMGITLYFDVNRSLVEINIFQLIEEFEDDDDEESID